MPLRSVALSLHKNSSLITILPEPYSSCSEWNISVQKVIHTCFLKITESLLRDTVGQNGLFWIVQKDNKKEQSQCTPGLRKIIRPEFSDFCKMLVDIEASTRDIFNVRTCRRKDKGVKADIYYFSVFCTSVNASFISIPDICHFWNANASGRID